MAARIGFVLLAPALAMGCSAIIEPDVDRLGIDAGGAEDAGTRDGGGDEDAGPMCPPSCDDGVDCTDDGCEDFACVNEPDDSACGDGERCSPVLGCVPEVCTRDEECDDAMFCNGVERCIAGAPGTGCLAGDPVACPDDDAACSTAFCDEQADACSFMLDHAMCADEVACTEDRCVAEMGCAHEADDSLCETDFCTIGSACDASNGCTDGMRRPCDDGSPCTDDSCSDALEMCVNELRDEDGDGYFLESVRTTGGPPVMCGGDDCDDGIADINPAATERCDRVDNNCNDVVDEGCPVLVPGDDCGSATVISLLGGTNMATMSRAFAGLTDNYQTNPYCEASTGGRDAVYAVDIPAGVWDVTIDTNGSAADTVIAVGFECSNTAFNGVCNDDIDSGVRWSRIWAHRVGGTTATRIFVLVDAWSSSEMGSFTINVRRSAAAPDSCPSGTGGAFPLDISGGGAVVGVNLDRFSDESGSCCNPIGGCVDTWSEAIFRVRRPSAGNMNFDIYSLDFTPYAYLQRSPGCGTEVGCELGRDLGGGFRNVLLRRSVNNELHYLLVDGGPGTYAIYYEPF